MTTYIFTSEHCHGLESAFGNLPVCTEQERDHRHQARQPSGFAHAANLQSFLDFLVQVVAQLHVS
jgi:hypothetical protein